MAFTRSAVRSRLAPPNQPTNSTSHPVLCGQHSRAFSVEAWSKAVPEWYCRGGRESRGRVPRQLGEGRMSYIFFILAMGPMSAAGIYSPQVTHHNRCIVEPGTFDALYCPAPAAPPAHPHHKK